MTQDVLLADLFNTLDIVVFERVEEELFKLLTPLPSWFIRLCPEGVVGREIRLVGKFEFLDNFLVDAELHWQKGSGRLRSGPWHELDEQKVEYVLEASAVSIGSKRLLLIEFLKVSYKELETIVQKARLNSLLISSLLRQQRSLDEDRRAALEASRFKSEFLANVSHEIRTPLNAVIGLSGLLMETPLSEVQKELVQTVRKSGEALLDLVNDILDLSKIEAGKIDLEVQEFDLRKCIEEALALVGVRAAEKSIDLAYSIDVGVGDCFIGDVTRLRQILVNLLGNAVKFTEQGEVVLTVSCVDGDLFFRIRDTGIGIEREKLDKIFRPFTQASSAVALKYGGTGLGLAISKKLVELMGGTIGVESELGKGSCFYFTLPVKPTATGLYRHLEEVQPWLLGKKVLISVSAKTTQRLLIEQCERWGMQVLAADAATTCDVAIVDAEGVGVRAMAGRILLSYVGANLGGRDFLVLPRPFSPDRLYYLLARIFDQLVEKDAVSAGPIGKRLKILLAEDHPINQKVTLLMLKSLGQEADVVANGLEAIEALRRRHYDLVLMDVNMPEMDGLEATREICRLWPEGRPKIVAMTASAMQSDREECLLAGMDNYITKPIRIEELRKLLQELT
ncbi:MAG: ATP-binding protein [Acidobacteriota bacterium]|nr:ATP-binding protein [Blastocatellia bacterium]MDW8411380.1 ATP-binding protein [Acidobacteriota bacterium]